MENKKFECSAVLNGCEIELTNYCGLDCFGCTRKQSSYFGYLDFVTLQKIVFYIKKQKYSEIVFSGLGDVFLHKDLYKFIDYIFEIIPNIKIYIMTKGQSITEEDINKMLNYKKNGFIINITYSIFSLNKEKYNNVTGGGNLEYLLKIIKYSYQKNINFNFEFFLDKNNYKNIIQFKKFVSLFNKEFVYSIPHNWGGYFSKEKYKKIYDKKILNEVIEYRKKGEICEAFSGNYVFFDYKGDIYKCGLKRFNSDLFLGNIGNIIYDDKIKNINYNKCKNCSYYKYKTKI